MNITRHRVGFVAQAENKLQDEFVVFIRKHDSNLKLPLYSYLKQNSVICLLTRKIIKDTVLVLIKTDFMRITEKITLTAFGMNAGT